eukprot:799841-Rhodomonas_salina.1
MATKISVAGSGPGFARNDRPTLFFLFAEGLVIREPVVKNLVINNGRVKCRERDCETGGSHYRL